ncbi:SDR family NAD(P)-dependent oxidoreductase [Novosphingobium kaempferiae]|uniref:SDR family NAD(P)-dependent oxidoreductase n=1 Tax=Novosphingobium kaempferiae TaxID=2896849 RepID=UPI001E460AF1|nr:SDR family oxidoreductase [Novosphingobium kaempferiae]
MQIDLSGKTAVITGSTEGIGLAVAAKMIEAGAKVVINGRRKDKVDAALDKLGSSARGVAADLGDAGGCASLLASAKECDILVSNLAIFEASDFFEATDACWERHWQLNVMAGVRLARAYLPAMAAKGWGRAIFLSSEAGYGIPPEMIHYAVSKIADVALARGLAKRMAGTGVTVNSVIAGPTLSEGFIEMYRQEIEESGQSVEDATAELVRTFRPTSILRRAATVDEVANMVVYAASPQASATTGAALRVDGGIVDTLI